MLIPSTNTTVESEYNRLLLPTLQAHVGRLGKGVNMPFAPSRPEDIDYQARILGSARVEVVCLAQTSASLFDDEYGAVTKRRMTAGARVPSLTSAEAIGQAVRALRARRIALVSPLRERQPRPISGRPSDGQSTRSDYRCCRRDHQAAAAGVPRVL